MFKIGTTILYLLLIFSCSIFSQDPREKNHSLNIVPFIDQSIQKYYVTWSSSSGSNDGWQHDIYNQIISFSSTGEIIFDSTPHRFIGTGNDEAQEPVSVSINPKNNTMISVWEDGSGSTVDIRGQMHKSDGTIIRENWIIAGGNDSQHSPDVVHLDGVFLVSLTDEAPPAQTSMNEIRILDDETGEQISSFELSPRNEDNWWAISTSNNKNIAFVGWGNGEDFFGSVIKINADTVLITPERFYVSNIDQYYYSVAWLEKYDKFIAVVKVNSKSVVCLIDTNGVRSNFTSIPNAPITRETELAVSWNAQENVYNIIYTSGYNNLSVLKVTNSKITLTQIISNVLENANWPTTGIACQFVHSIEGKDLWDLDKRLFVAYNNENSNNAVYHLINIGDLTKVKSTKQNIHSEKIKLYHAYPNPFNPSVMIRYRIPMRDKVSLRIYNVQGEVIKTLKNDIMPPGEYNVVWNGENSQGAKVGSGVYIIRLISGKFVKSNKIIFQK